MWLLDYEPAVVVLNLWRKHCHKKKRDLCGINERPLVLPTVVLDIKLLNMSFCIQRSTNVAVRVSVVETQ